MSDETYSGSCFCGSIKYTATGPVRYLCLCHCESCRRAAGAPFVAWGSVDVDNFEITAGSMSIHESSPGVCRGFCKQCGCSLTYSNKQREKDIDFTLDSLEDPTVLAPTAQIYVVDKISWIETNPDLPQYPTVPGAEDNDSI